VAVKLRNVVVASLLSSVLCLVACIPVFERPLPLPERLVYDRSLRGSWIRQGGGDTHGELVFAERPNGWFRMTVGRATDDDPSNDTCSGFTRTIGKDTYMCITWRTEQSSRSTQPGERVYLLAWYRVTGDELQLRIFDPKKLGELVEQGRLTGSRTGEGELGEQYRISSPGTVVEAILAQDGPNAVLGESEPTCYRRKPAAR